MRKIHILALLTLCFLNVAISENVIKIGTVTIRQDTNLITLIQDNRTNVLERSDCCLDYAYVITTPFIKYDGVDGILKLKDEDGFKYKCKGLRPIPWNRSIRKSDFVLFPLFDNKPTCLGVLKGVAGATGRSSQNLIFLDTASNRHLEFSTIDMHDPVWIMGKDHPIGFKTFNSLSVGPSVVSLGLGPRLEMVYSLVDGAFVPDEKLKMNEVKQFYDQISFNPQEKIELCNTNWMDMDRDIGDKLLDAVYYGTILGKRDEVNHLLNMVAPELRGEIKKSFVPYIPTNPPDVTNPTENNVHGQQTISTPMANKLTAFEFRGNIFIKDKDSKVTRLTSSGKNRNPLLSPDGKNLVYLRKSNRNAHLAVGDESDYIANGSSILADQIWMINLTTQKEQLLVKDKDLSEANSMEEVIAFISDLCFTPDSKRLYFLTSCWATTSALHVVMLDTLKEKFVCSASSLEVVQSGEYHGHLVVSQHKYFIGGGSYDWYWLMTPEGKEVGPLCNEGEDWKAKIESAAELNSFCTNATETERSAFQMFTPALDQQIQDKKPEK